MQEPLELDWEQEPLELQLLMACADELEVELMDLIAGGDRLEVGVLVALCVET